MEPTWQARQKLYDQPPPATKHDEDIVWDQIFTLGMELERSYRSSITATHSS